jgi:hypothetical protein
MIISWSSNKKPCLNLYLCISFKTSWNNGTSSGPSDISPTAGEIIFGENQAAAIVTFSVLQDEVGFDSF